MTGRMKNEKDVKREVKKLLKKHQWFHWMPANNGYGVSGTADILALRAGVFLAVETKFKYNKPSVMQARFLETVLAESGFGFVVNERTLEAFQAWLEAFDRACIAASKQEPVVDDDGVIMLNAIQILTQVIAEVNDAADNNSPEDTESPEATDDPAQGSEQ